MHVFRNYFVTLGANSVHDAQKTSLVLCNTVIELVIVKEGLTPPRHLFNLNRIHFRSELDSLKILK